MKVEGALTLEAEMDQINFEATMREDDEPQRGFRTWDWTAVYVDRDGEHTYEGELIHSVNHSIIGLGSKVLMAVHMAMLMDEAAARSATGND